MQLQMPTKIKMNWICSHVATDGVSLVGHSCLLSSKNNEKTTVEGQNLFMSLWTYSVSSKKFYSTGCLKPVMLKPVGRMLIFRRIPPPRDGRWGSFSDAHSALQNKGQRRRDDNKNKICAFEGGGPWGQRGKSFQKRCFFSWETPRQLNFESAHFIVEKILLSLRRLLKGL